MRWRWNVGVVVAAVATTFTSGAFASSPLDTDDPWTSLPMKVAAPRLKHKPAPLDESDPWQDVTPAPVTRPPRPSHDGLREAIQRALDAGDYRGAAALQETLDLAF